MPKNSRPGSSSNKKGRRINREPSNGTSHSTKKKLIQFIQQASEIERKLQIIKEMLCEEADFTPQSLFHRFDSVNKKYITEKDIEDFLIDAQIPFKGSELKTLFGRIDVNRSDTISSREWQNFILPNQNPRLRYETVRRPVFIPRPHEKLSEKIQWIVAKFFRQIISQYTKLGEFNTSLINSFDFDANEVFNLLSCGNSFISPESIKQFMDDNAAEISKEEIGCLIKLIDKSGQAKIHPNDLKFYLATMGLKKEHEIFDELSPIPALKDFTPEYIDRAIKEREKSLKERYKDNKSYVKGMDEEGHHILGYSRVRDQRPIYGQQNKFSWLSSSDKKRF